MRWRRLDRDAWQVWLLHEQGPNRRRQEDAWAVLPSAAQAGRTADVFAVFDGLGGIPMGAEAAKACAAALPEALRSAIDPVHALQMLDQAALDVGGATTIALALFRHGDIAGTGTAFAVGDSAVFAPVSAGRGSDLFGEGHRSAGGLQAALGFNSGLPLEARLHVPLGAALVLCTDGVTDVVDRILLERLAAGGAAFEANLEQVRRDLADSGLPDNATLLVARRTR